MAARHEEGRRLWHLFELLGDWTRPCFSEHRIVLPSVPPDWNAIVELSSSHMIAPAVGWALAGYPALPDHVSQYFGAILDLNRERNAAVLTSLERVLQVLNARDIVPVLLKGGAMLADHTYPDPGIRVVVDLDLLVPDPISHVAFESLSAAGFIAGQAPTPPGHHHLPNQIDPSTGVRVEIHGRPLWLPLGDLVTSRSCLEGRTIQFRSCQVIIPNATDRVAHSIGHSQLADRRYRRAVPHLRQLLDLAMLRSRHDGEIDWTAIEQCFDRQGFRPVLVDNLALVEALLVQQAPAGLGGHAAKATARMKRSLDRGPFARRVRSVLWTLQDARQAFRIGPAWAFRRVAQVIKAIGTKGGGSARYGRQ